jgi:hypothetical protein
VLPAAVAAVERSNPRRPMVLELCHSGVRMVFGMALE